ncbi:MAG: GC-type dockerin domain-anchored protein, partial [Phycisphaerales bacterium]
GDVNGDGYDDLAIGSYTNSDGAQQGGRVDIVSGADGSVLRAFTGTVAFAQLGFDCVGIGDTDGDGALDFILSAANGSLVYIGAGTDVICAGDLNLDGVVNPKDVVAWYASYAAGDCRADINGDGVTNGDDLGVILGNFGKCKRTK